MSRKDWRRTHTWVKSKEFRPLKAFPFVCGAPTELLSTLVRFFCPQEPAPAGLLVKFRLWAEVKRKAQALLTL